MIKINIAPDAKEDLQDIKKYIAEKLNSPAAVNTVTKITKAIRWLANYPNSGKPLITDKEITRNYRFLVCGNYLVFYQIKSEIVQILRILYGKKNYIKAVCGSIYEDELKE